MEGKESNAMIVDTKAYVLSMIAVLLCSVIRDFLIPLLVWRKHLRNKSYPYRFWFCVITQAALQINQVLLLGFLDICSRYTLLASNILIYGLIIWNYSDKRFFHRCRKLAEELWNAYKHERIFSFTLQCIRRWRGGFTEKIQRWTIWEHMKNNCFEIILLAGLVLYNLWFLLYPVMKVHSYQFPDIPVHQSWIYWLEHDTLFVDGVYPFGMHAMIYFIRAIFGLNLREILLYSGAYQTVLLIIGIYLLAKEVFYAKYTPITVVVFISMMLNQSRYATSLPQEAGMYAVAGLAYFMLRYLHVRREKFVITSDRRLRRAFRMNSYLSRRYIKSEAILLMLCVALVIAYHFYTAIAAIFFVLAIALAYLPRVLKKQYFIPLMYAGIMGAVIAVLPLLACLARGIPFNGSMAWATSVITGEKWEGSELEYKDELADSLGKDTIIDQTEEDQEGDRVKVDYAAMTPEEILRYYYQAIYEFGSDTIFRSDAIQLMFLCMLGGALAGLLLLFAGSTRTTGHDYIAFILYILILFTFGSAEKLGLVELIESARIATFAEPFIGFIILLPVDFVLRILGQWRNRYYQFFLNLMSFAACCGLAAVILITGWFHDIFYFEQAYYNEAEYVLRHIKKTYAKNTFTIVSPTAEYYDVLDYGYHTQLSQFVDMVNGKQESFTFPTKYVFFFIEKRVLNDYLYGYVDVSWEYAVKDFVYLADEQDYHYQRAVLESQAYYWAQEFMRYYPKCFKVFYEDDIYVVYLLEQNIDYPYHLQINYRDNLPAKGRD